MTSLASVLFFVFYSFCVPFQMLMATQLQKKAGYSLFQREPTWSLWPLQVRHWCIIQLVNNLLSDPACMQVMWGVREREREKEGTWNMNKCFNISLTSFLCSHWRLFVFLFWVYVIMYSWHIFSPLGCHLSVLLHGYSSERPTLISFFDSVEPNWMWTIAKGYV